MLLVKKRVRLHARLQQPVQQLRGVTREKIHEVVGEKRGEALIDGFVFECAFVQGAVHRALAGEFELESFDGDRVCAAARGVVLRDFPENVGRAPRAWNRGQMFVLWIFRLRECRSLGSVSCLMDFCHGNVVGASIDGRTCSQARIARPADPR